jgi:hypothetical protein
MQPQQQAPEQNQASVNTPFGAQVTTEPGMEMLPTPELPGAM